MMKSFRTLILLAIALLPMSVAAEKIDSNKAETMANEFFSRLKPDASTPNKKARRAANAAVASSAQQADFEPYYVFNAADNQGFVIISGDDRAKKVLGYSDRGSFDTDNMPPQLKELLNQYAEQIATLPASLPTDASWLSDDTPAESDGVLLETANWGQNYPYNAQCPIIDGVQCPTGCVATAMAIVMKYHNWPPKGHGHVSYDNQGQNLTFNFENSLFDFNDMPDPSTIDPSDWSENQINAVATLMEAAGKSVFMNYEQSQSGTSSRCISASMTDNFYYTNNIKSQTNLLDSEFLLTVKNQINKDCPMILSAWNVGSNGHTFVCDGYSGDMIHINWGWDGLSNGYFYVNDLLDFKDYREILSEITPCENIPDTDINYDFYIDGNFNTHYNSELGYIRINKSKITAGEPFDVFVGALSYKYNDLLIEFTYPYFPDPLDYKYTLGLVLADKNGVVKDVFWQLNLSRENLYHKTADKDLPIRISKYERFEWTNNGIYQQEYQTYNFDIYDCQINSGIEPEDKIFVALSPKITDENVDRQWHIIPGINCENFSPVTNIPQTFSLLTWIGNVDHEIDDFQRDDYAFWGRCYYVNVRPQYDSKGDKLLSSIKFDGEIIGSNFLEPNKNSHTISCNAFSKNELLSVTLSDVDNNIETRLKAYDIDLIGSLKIAGKVSNADLNYIYTHLSSLLELDLSKAELSEKSDWNNPIPGQLSQSNLQTLRLPINTKDIPVGCFRYFLTLRNIYLPKSVSIIQPDAFSFYSNNTINIVVENENPNIDISDNFFSKDYVDNYCLWVPEGTKDKYMESPIWGQIHNIFEGEPTLIDFYHQGVKYQDLGEIAFVDRSDWEYVWPNVKILDYINVNDKIIPVEIIKYAALFGSEVKNIKIGDCVKTIEEAFGCCRILESITIGRSVKNIDKRAFVYDDNLTIFYLNNISPVDFSRLIRIDGWGNECELIAKELFTPYLLPNFAANKFGIAYIPGGCQNNYANIGEGEVKEMWAYKIDRTQNLISLKPNIESLTFDQVKINGEVIEPDGFIYTFAKSDKLDVEVTYTLNDYEQMTTHYDAEFNAKIADSELGGINEVINDSINSGYVKVYDMMGVECYSGERDTLSRLAPGVYILRQGSKSEKFIVK